MAWETRGASRRYYYRSRRLNGRVVKVYVGHGEPAEQAAKTDAEARARRDADRQEAQRTEAMLEPLDALGAEFDEGFRLLTMATLFVAGLHQHKGQWRRRRNVDTAS